MKGSARFVVPGQAGREIKLSLERLKVLEAMTPEELRNELGDECTHASLPSSEDLAAHLNVANDLTLPCFYPQAISCPNLDAILTHRDNKRFRNDRRMLCRQFLAVLCGVRPKRRMSGGDKADLHTVWVGARWRE